MDHKFKSIKGCEQIQVGGGEDRGGIHGSGAGRRRAGSWCEGIVRPGQFMTVTVSVALTNHAPMFMSRAWKTRIS